MLKGSPVDSAQYITRALKLLCSPQLRPFIFVPLAINFVLFLIVTGLLIQLFGDTLDWLMDWLPSWLNFLAWMLWSLFAAIILLVYGYSFSLISNIIAAPFNGLLAEKVEEMVSGQRPPDESFGHMALRTLGSELVKLWYFISRGVGLSLCLLLLMLIPGVNLLVPIIAFLWGAWCMAVQYSDYPADNHQLRFSNLRYRLGEKKITSYSFGSYIMLGKMIPVINIFVMPIAVTAATLYWVEDLKQQSSPS